MAEYQSVKEPDILRTESEAQTVGIFTQPFGDARIYFEYSPVKETLKWAVPLLDTAGNIMQDPVTGAVLFKNPPVEEEVTLRLETVEKILPIKNIHELGLTSAILNDPDKNTLALKLIESHSHLCHVLKEFITENRGSEEIREIAWCCDELHDKLGALVDTSKGTGIMARLLRTAIKDESTDFRQAQLYREEQTKGFDIIGKLRERGKNKGGLPEPQKIW